jgi:hypothetical protein
VLRRLEFHYVPKHASWLNMVEIEIGVLASQCLDRRIDSYRRLVAETAAWEKRRNAELARIKWMFTTEKARAKNGPRLSQPRGQIRPNSKSQNPCDEVLVACDDSMNSAVKRVPRRSPFGEIIIRANCHSKDFQMAWYRTAACAPLARLDSEQSPM